MCLTILVSEKHELVSEKSGKSQGILFHQSAGNPDVVRNDLNQIFRGMKMVDLTNQTDFILHVIL